MRAVVLAAVVVAVAAVQCVRWRQWPVMAAEECWSGADGAARGSGVRERTSLLAASEVELGGRGTSRLSARLPGGGQDVITAALLGIPVSRCQRRREEQNAHRAKHHAGDTVVVTEG